MTYRELIEFCHNSPKKECYDGKCSHRKECDVFKNAVGYYPSLLHGALDVDWNAEISDAETVEIIRCKDCFCYEVVTFKDGENKSYCDYFSGHWGTYDVEENDYCSRAVRKEENIEHN